MKKLTRFKEPQILSILRQAEGGVPVTELCGEYGMSNASFYKWRAKYGGVDASMIAQPRCWKMRTAGRRKCLQSSACRTSC